MAEIHVDPDGDDVTGDGSLLDPYETIGKLEDEIAQDDEGLIHAGSYPDTQALTAGGQFFITLPNGSGSGNYTKIGAYDSEVVTLLNTRTTVHSIVRLKQGAESIWLNELICDGANLGSSNGVTCFSIGFQGSSTSFNVDIKLTDIESKNYGGQGIQTSNLRNSLVDGALIHDNVTKGADFNHGIYMSASSHTNIYRNLTIYNISGHGFQIFSSTGPHDNIIEQFRIFKCGQVPFDGGQHKPNIVCLRGPNNVFRNGLTYDGNGGGLHLGGSNNALYFIASYNNGIGGTSGSGGLAVISGSGHKVKNCISINQHANAVFGNYADSGTSTDDSNNIFATHLATDVWTDPANATRLSADFTLIASPTTDEEIAASAAIVEQGVSVGVTTDFVDGARPNPPDIGPYQKTAGAGTLNLIAHTSPVEVAGVETWTNLGATLVDGDSNTSELTLEMSDGSVRLTTTTGLTITETA